MTLLPTDLEHQPQHRQRGHRITHHSTPLPLEVNENCHHHQQAQQEKSSDDRAEDLRVCCNSRMDEIQRSPIKHALRRSMSNEDNNGNISEEGAEKKRQRVENIVINICQPRSPKSQDLTANSELQKNKRKQFIPQQHGSTLNGDIDVVTSDALELKPTVSAAQFNEVKDSSINQRNEERKIEKENALLKNQIKIMSEQLQKNQQMTHELNEKMKMERYELMSARLALHQPQIEMETCVRAIRAEINQAVKLAFKEALDKHSAAFATPAAYSKDKATSTIREPAHREITPAHINTSTNSSMHLAEQLKRSNSTLPQPVPSSPHMPAPPAHHSLPNPLLPLPLYYGQAFSATQSHFAQTNSLASHLNNNMMSAQLFQAAMENELMESQIYRDRENQQNKKKRTKVTDTRLSPRAPKLNESLSPPTKQEIIDPVKMFDSYGPGSALFPAMNSISSMHNALISGFCTQQQSEAMRNINGGVRSPIGSDNSDHCEPSSPETSMTLHPALPGQNITLTPLHLRKAKLMFFYVRYPSSVLLKNFFCDVHFNKNNTAQLVKWFSNFREFYYIQMEKYARQSIAEGLGAEQVEVSTESELYKILNLHYNRNNQIEVPRSFLDTIQTTLREFIKAVSVGKDREQSWKKPIYKVIARLDDGVPEYFKSQDWVDQLSD